MLEKRWGNVSRPVIELVTGTNEPIIKPRKAPMSAAAIAVASNILSSRLSCIVSAFGRNLRLSRPQISFDSRHLSYISLTQSAVLSEKLRVETPAKWRWYLSWNRSAALFFFFAIKPVRVTTPFKTQTSPQRNPLPEQIYDVYYHYWRDVDL